MRPAPVSELRAAASVRPTTFGTITGGGAVPTASVALAGSPSLLLVSVAAAIRTRRPAGPLTAFGNTARKLPFAAGVTLTISVDGSTRPSPFRSKVTSTVATPWSSLALPVTVRTDPRATADWSAGVAMTVDGAELSMTTPSALICAMLSSGALLTPFELPTELRLYELPINVCVDWKSRRRCAQSSNTRSALSA